MLFSVWIPLIFSWSVASAQGKYCPQGLTEFAPGSESVDLKNCVHLKKVSLSRLKLNKVAVNHSVWTNVEVHEVLMERGAFIGTRFENGEFRRWRAFHLDFDQTIWLGSYVKDSNFSSSNFGNAQLRGTRWYGVNASRANFHNAQFSNCLFQNVNFEGADLRGARMENCVFLGANFKGALFNRDTVMPFSSLQRAAEGMVYHP